MAISLSVAGKDARLMMLVELGFHLLFFSTSVRRNKEAGIETKPLGSGGQLRRQKNIPCLRRLRSSRKLARVPDDPQWKERCRDDAQVESSTSLRDGLRKCVEAVMAGEELYGAGCPQETASKKPKRLTRG